MPSMSLRRLGRHYGGVRIGIVIAVLLIVLALGPSMTSYAPSLSLFIKWLINVVLLPLIIYLAIRLTGETLMTRAGTAFKALGSALVGVVSPIVLAYLFLNGTLGIISYVIHFNKLPSIFAASFVIIVGAVIINYGRGGFGGEPIKSSLRYIGFAVLLYGIAWLMAIAYAPLGTPFLYASIGSALMGVAILISLHPSLKPLASDLSRVARPIVALLFVVGLMAMFAQIPQLRPYSGYLTMMSMILLAIVVVIIGYRLYTAFSGIARGLLRGSMSNTLGNRHYSLPVRMMYS
ncbi:hypothetical protein [Vulcanisaeta distributa]|uniref:hypothetical protein n=1 Tax=Vulcanisaeta distributa TaxID=164451 RepID=UPI001FB316DB|nr:hypothetical protein [Vulcanisaeta distributa]